jgi:hypothetical protein
MTNEQANESALDDEPETPPIEGGIRMPSMSVSASGHVEPPAEQPTTRTRTVPAAINLTAEPVPDDGTMDSGTMDGGPGSTMDFADAPPRTDVTTEAPTDAPGREDVGTTAAISVDAEIAPDATPALFNGGVFNQAVFNGGAAPAPRPVDAATNDDGDGEPPRGFQGDAFGAAFQGGGDAPPSPTPDTSADPPGFVADDDTTQLFEAEDDSSFIATQTAIADSESLAPSSSGDTGRGAFDPGAFDPGVFDTAAPTPLARADGDTPSPAATEIIGAPPTELELETFPPEVIIRPDADALAVGNTSRATGGNVGDYIFETQQIIAHGDPFEVHQRVDEVRRTLYTLAWDEGTPRIAHDAILLTEGLIDELLQRHDADTLKLPQARAWLRDASNLLIRIVPIVSPLLGTERAMIVNVAAVVFEACVNRKWPS